MARYRLIALSIVVVAALVLAVRVGKGQGISLPPESRNIVIIIERSEHVQQGEGYLIDEFRQNLMGIKPWDNVGVIYYGSTATALRDGVPIKATMENKAELFKQIEALKPEANFEASKSALPEAVKLAAAMKPRGILLMGPSHIGPMVAKLLDQSPALWVNVVAMPDSSKETRGELEGWTQGRYRQVKQGDIDAYVQKKHAASQQATASQPATKTKP